MIKVAVTVFSIIRPQEIKSYLYSLSRFILIYSLIITSHLLSRGGLSLRLVCSASFKHPHIMLLRAADRLFPVLEFSSVSLAEGSGQMAMGTSAVAINPLDNL